MNKPKILALYLPQFHRIPENDTWWGEGFTEWTAVKNARPLFPGHYEPRIPAHGRYYNLLDKSTMEWQAGLARKAGIYGFCMYHYWFGNGKQLLEKPAENLMKWRDIKIHYCFSWANESWIASWSKLKGNPWNGRAKTPEEADDKGMLMEQSYGDKKEWYRHFMYLLPFFKDTRYIKQDGKPVFVIYKPDEIPCLKEMTDYWNELAVENGFCGIYFIGTNSGRKSATILNASFLYEPQYSICQQEEKCTWEKLYWNLYDYLAKHNIDISMLVSWQRIWNNILERKARKNEYYGGYVGFDNTPRHGKKKATIYLKPSPRRFERNFRKLYEKSMLEKKEYVFITAWNEWGEGAYLEPDQRYGTGYLKAIRRVVESSRKGKIG